MKVGRPRKDTRGGKQTPQPGKAVGRPKNPQARQAISLTLNPDAMAKLDSMSDRQGISRSEVVNKLLIGAVGYPVDTLWAIVLDATGQPWAWLSSREHINLITGERLPERQIKVSKVLWENKSP